MRRVDEIRQAAVVTPLNEAWPGLVVVGEEDLACEVSAAAAGAVRASPLAAADAPAAAFDAPVTAADAPLRRDRCAGLATLAAAAAAERRDVVRAPLDRIAVFVDPLDGTREFVEGRVEAVQCLVGVAVDGRAVAGAVGIPFDGAGGVVVFGLAGAGVGATAPRPPAPPRGPGRPVVAVGDTDDATLRAAYDDALGAEGVRELVGGTGTKILAVAEGRADVAVMNFKSSSWDTCAPEAVLRAAGGRLTDIFGDAIVHRPDPPAPATFLNALGAVASGPGYSAAHDAVRAAMVADAGARQRLAAWGLAADAGEDDVEEILAARRAALRAGAAAPTNSGCECCQ